MNAPTMTVNATPPNTSGHVKGCSVGAPWMNMKSSVPMARRQTRLMSAIVPIGMSRSSCAPSFAGHCVGDALCDGADELHQAPNRRDADGASADEAHLAAEDGFGDFGDLAGHAAVRYGIKNRPRDQQAAQHGDADADADEVTGADERKREADGDAAHARADAEEFDTVAAASPMKLTICAPAAMERAPKHDDQRAFVALQHILRRFIAGAPTFRTSAAATPREMAAVS